LGEEQEQYSYRHFFLAFALAFFALSLSFLFLMTTVHPSTPKSLEVEELTPHIPYMPTGQDALTVLFIGSQTGAVEAGGFILVRFDPVGGAVPVVVFPPQTLVENGDKREALSQVYRYGGADYTRKALEKTLGVTIHRYVRMQPEAFLACADLIGSVEFDLPADLPVQRGNMHVVLSAGPQLLDGQKVLDIITCGGAEEDELAQYRLTGDLVAAIVNQRMDVVQSTLIDKIFGVVINLIDTDISFLDYDNRKEAALYMAEQSRDPAYPLPVAGQMEDGGAGFTLSDTFIVQVVQAFS